MSAFTINVVAVLLNLSVLTFNLAITPNIWAIASSAFWVGANLTACIAIKMSQR